MRTSRILQRWPPPWGATVVLRQVRTGEALCHHDPLRLAAAFRDAFEGALGDVTDLSGRDDM